ncbi:exodeoxyribonuclease VII small subunit [Kangiella sp. HZ709]|uniref:exodeoxyribonuclease VII small subunit n=1 Tax=Kangiella sp. HZ709 TaxID=2666328 RepID=UPI0012AF9230|nr:exodeoxyribonuclease VII small subunit [Kangiella sp. HZ709]MRX28672.1 exodeoxyribonuclease VII small subunit [Kangiella sp. HZ709]
MAAAKKNNFENQLEELEALVEQLEDGDLPLDEALKIFEKGVKLSRQCQKHLAEAEQKVTILMNGKEEVFDAEE